MAEVVIYCCLHCFEDSHDGIKEAPVDSYIIPTQSGNSCHSLILYTAVEREGAVEEAERLQAGLAHCTAPKVKQWSGVTDLMAELHKYLTEIPRDCKLLIVCIMGHGTVGYITGKDGSKIPANDVLNLASKELNFKLPTVSRVDCWNITVHDITIWLAQGCVSASMQAFSP